MRKSARNRIIIWSVVTLLLIGLLAVGIRFFSEYSLFGSNPFGVITFNEFEKYDYSTGNAEFTSDKVETITVNWISGNIKFVQGKGDKIKIEENSNSAIPQNKAMKYALDGKKLIINSGEISSFFNFLPTGLSKDLTVTIPKDKSLDDVEINCASSHVSIKGTEIEKLSTDSASGDVEINNVTGNTADISTVSGEIVINSNFDAISSGSISGKITITGNCSKLDTSSVSGEINADLTDEIDNIDMESVSGNVNITIPEKIGGFTADYDTVSGDFSTDFSVKTIGNSHICGDGSAEFDFETVSGDIKITAK